MGHSGRALGGSGDTGGPESTWGPPVPAVLCPPRHDVAEVAGLTSFSFGDDEDSRYVMVFKKVRDGGTHPGGTGGAEGTEDDSGVPRSSRHPTRSWRHIGVGRSGTRPELRNGVASG